MKIFLFLTVFCLSALASANLVNSAWTGESKLFINDELYCSDNSIDRPPVLNPASGYFTLHKGSADLIWPYIGGGCAMNWNNEYMPFHVVDSKLMDLSGNTVGTISKLRIEAKNFYSERKKFFIESLVVNSNDLENMIITVSYQQLGHSKKYRFTGIYKRHHDSVWP